MFYSLPEEELRTICRVNIEAFEKWARTVIHSELTTHLGENYFDIELSPNVPIVKKGIRDKTAIMMRNHPQRFHRKIVHSSRQSRGIDIEGMISNSQLYFRYSRQKSNYDMWLQGVESVFLNALLFCYGLLITFSSVILTRCSTSKYNFGSSSLTFLPSAKKRFSAITPMPFPWIPMKNQLFLIFSSQRWSL